CNVALVLDVARQVKALGLRPRRTLRFVLWNGEEQGLGGAPRSAQRHGKARGLPPRRTRRFVLWNGEEQGLVGSLGYVKRHGPSSIGTWRRGRSASGGGAPPASSP